MTIAIEKSDSISKQLYDILVSRNLDVTATDLYGKTVTDPSEVSVFSFIYKTENKSYGHVVIALDSNNNIEFMYSGNMASEMEREDREGWYNFLQLIRVFAKRNLLKFSAKDISKVKYTMQGIAASMNESTLVESYYGNKHTSFSDLPESTKLVIKHNKSIGESDLRYRHIESIFIETAEGERFKVPSKSLAEAKALARHVSEGGKPYDKLGKHISEMASECRMLSKLKRKYNGAEDLNEDEASMVNTGLARFESLRKDLKKCASKKGYAELKESYMAELGEQKKNVKESKMKRKMRELEMFESWASTIVESSWTMPDTPGKQEELAAILREPLPVGPDATNAISTLTDLIGDRELHRRLEKVAANDADVDAVPTIIGWMEENGNNPTIKTVLDMVNPSDQPAPAPEEPASEPEQSFDEPEPEIPEEPVPAEPRRESKENKKKVVECWAKPFAKRTVEHNGAKVTAMVFESSVHARQYVKHNPGFEHLFTDDVGAYVGRVVEDYEIEDLHPEIFNEAFLKENIGDSLDYSLIDELKKYSARYSNAIPGKEYIYMSIAVSPIHNFISLAKFNSPHALVRQDGNVYVFEVNGAERRLPSNSNDVRTLFVFESQHTAEKFLTWLRLKADGANINEKIIDQKPVVGEFSDQNLDQLVQEYDDLNDIEPEYEDDDYGDEDEGEFYLVMYDEDEGTTFVGGVRNSGGREGWNEFRVAGDPPYNWGSGSYMGYLTPQDVMHWIYKDYDRGYEIKGPFSTKEEAIQWASHNFGPVEEGRETQAYIKLGGQTAQKVQMQPMSTRSLAQWKETIKKSAPWADVKQKGDRLVATMGDQILGTFDFNTKEGHIFAESKTKKRNKKV